MRHNVANFATYIGIWIGIWNDVCFGTIFLVQINMSPKYLSIIILNFKCKRTNVPINILLQCYIIDFTTNCDWTRLVFWEDIPGFPPSHWRKEVSAVYFHSDILKWIFIPQDPTCIQEMNDAQISILLNERQRFTPKVSIWSSLPARMMEPGLIWGLSKRI